MLPNVKNTIKRFSQPVNLITVATSIVNHRPVETETVTQINAVIQQADREKLNKDGLDFSLGYIQVNSLDKIKIGDMVEYNGVRYKAFEVADFHDYGYYEAIMEEQK